MGSQEALIPIAKRVVINEDSLAVELVDGSTLLVPLASFPRLLHGSPEQRMNWRLIGTADGLHWPDLDEDISIENLLLGKVSGESEKSLDEWLKKRA